ncbi:DUF188 domain-containing protein [Parasphaerochaeta coccoides]|uniref:UPF0178 protein Spico_0888 n=1 Tax=Parasphaerochaeta coccoides (strain ATCC BAA-1237 / DSM 17374 / SPN1) TaxID=760011 RepID=F4GHZ9_PARC1|nr:DUF188 domain-containing protein [Parasphaerochaeta coccoides]AEC02112.1 UPF0178 protein yaiI [Parasphaerochaeta coccoides DSM 17374]
MVPSVSLDVPVALWVDADSCPRQLRVILLRAAMRAGVRAVFVADRKLPDVMEAIASHTHVLRELIMEDKPGIDKSDLRQIKSPVMMIVVTSGTDSADEYIVSHAEVGMIAVTRDVPLAARLARRGVTVLDDRGGVYDASTVGERLSSRNMMTDLREAGIFAERTRRMTTADIQSFAAALDTRLSALLREHPSLCLVPPVRLN